MVVSKTCDYLKIKIKMPNPSQEPQLFSNATYQDLKNLDVLCTFKIKIKSQSLNHRYVRDQWLYHNQDQDCKPQSGTFSILQSPFKIKILSPTIWNKVELKTNDHIQMKIKIPNHSQEPSSSSKALNKEGHGCYLHHQNHDRGPKFGK